MANVKDLKGKLLNFLSQNKKADLATIYLYFLEEKFALKPILFPKEKKIYHSLDSLISHLEKENKLYHETEIKIQFGKENVNEQTKRIYICPYSGKVFGDNTCPNPQDAIYDWVSKCPQNKGAVNGLRVKRFFISEDPKVIKGYITPTKASKDKIVYSSLISNKLFNSKEAVIEDFKKNYIRPLTLFEVQNQNKFEIESKFLEFLQKELSEEKVAAFVQDLSQHSEFAGYLKKWLK